MLKNKTLLIISSGFPDRMNSFYRGIFVKEQLKYIKNYFKEVVVIVPIVRSFGVKKEDRLCRDYKFDNVKVYFPRFWHAPISYFRERLSENQFGAADKLIRGRGIEFDILHAHFTWPSGYIGAKLKEKYRKPLILTIHEDSNWLGREISSNNEKLNLAWTLSDAIIRVNKKDIPLLKKYNKNVFNIPNGFSTEKFYPLDKAFCRRKLNLPQERKILVSLGFLTEQKGHMYAIEAIGKVVEKRTDILYLIGGSGELKDALQARINELGLQKYVRLLGFVPESDVCALINACDLFVLSSLSEGNPTVMFEALGCGKPVIATSVGGVPEIIINNAFGSLVETKNSSELADKILRDLNKKYYEKKILRYAFGFTWEKIAKSIANVYETVLP